MKSFLKKIGCFVLLLSGGYAAQAQDIHFSQFYETSILRNPSLIGIFNGDYKVGVQYRNQWSSISRPFETALLSGEVRIPVKSEANDFFSFGLLSYYDRAGSISMQTITVYPAVNFSKSMEDAHKSFLSVGFTGGFIQRSFDPSKVTVDNQYQNDHFDPSNPTGENFSNPSFSQWDFGAGFSFNSGAGQNNNVNYIIGLSGYHFTRPRSSFYDNAGIRTGVRANVNAGISVQASEVFSYQLHLNYTRQNTYNELIAGGFLGWNKQAATVDEIIFALYGGVFLRVGDAIVPTVKLKYRDYSFVFSYDVNISKLKAASNLQGGFELSVFKTGLFRSPQFEKSRTLCPHFY